MSSSPRSSSSSRYHETANGTRRKKSEEFNEDRLMGFMLSLRMKECVRMSEVLKKLASLLAERCHHWKEENLRYVPAHLSSQHGGAQWVIVGLDVHPHVRVYTPIEGLNLDF